MNQTSRQARSLSGIGLVLLIDTAWNFCDREVICFVGRPEAAAGLLWGALHACVIAAVSRTAKCACWGKRIGLGTPRGVAPPPTLRVHSQVLQLLPAPPDAPINPFRKV
jgi:hypothetical protein